MSGIQRTSAMKYDREKSSSYDIKLYDYKNTLSMIDWYVSDVIPIPGDTLILGSVFYKIESRTILAGRESGTHSIELHVKRL